MFHSFPDLVIFPFADLLTNLSRSVPQILPTPSNFSKENFLSLFPSKCCYALSSYAKSIDAHVKLTFISANNTSETGKEYNV